MAIIEKKKSFFLVFTIPLIIVLTSIFLAKQFENSYQYNYLSKAILFDLILTLPIVYFFSIRKSKIPKTTIIPIFFIGLLIASKILPLEKNIISNIITYFLPVIESFVLIYLIFKIKSYRKIFLSKKKDHSDFYSIIKATNLELFPEKIATLMSIEFSMVYFCFYKWRPKKVCENEFSYHKESGIRAILLIVILMIIGETLGLHFLLKSWNSTAAWILTGISIYSGLQLLGFFKSLSQRPYYISKTELFLPYGILGEANVILDNIKEIELSTSIPEDNQEIKMLSPLGELDSFNIILHFKDELDYTGFYGTKKSTYKLAIHVDKKQEFIDVLTPLINNLTF